MLDEKDLQAIKAIIDASEERMSAKIAASEERMSAKIAASEERMSAKIEERIEDTRSMLMAYFESAIEPKFNLLADQLALHRDTLASQEQVDQLEEKVSFLEPMALSTYADVEKLKKAQ